MSPNSRFRSYCPDPGYLGRRLSGIFATVMVGLCLGWSTLPVSAQTKYRPEHPEVKAMVDRAIGSLSLAGELPEATLATLAYVQYVKRYEGRVPKDNPAVNRTVTQLLSRFPDNGGSPDGDLFNGECYWPALALILLAEVDSVKYEKEIRYLLERFEQRQEPSGAFTYLGQRNTGDTSQTQFAALAMWVAKTRGIPVDVEMADKTLAWLCRVHGGSGQWVYKYRNGQSTGTPSTLSMHAAGLGSVYLLADFLQLYQRKKSLAKGQPGAVGLPRTVTLYVPVSEDGGNMLNQEGPLSKFDKGVLNATVNVGNQSFERRFTYGPGNWNHYYMYAVERYAYFREQAEGDTGSGSFKDWYDKGVDFLKSTQGGNGSFQGAALENSQIATSFAILFLVRSSEIINFPPASSQMQGGATLETDVTLRDTGTGKINAVRAEQNLSDLLSLLEDDGQADSETLARISKSLKKQVVEFRQREDKSRDEARAFFQSMVGAKNYYKQLIAVRFLAAEQDMDNVPALIYALSAPDFRVALEAHNGLRLISRKIDSMMLSEETLENATRDPDILKQNPELLNRMRSDFRAMEKKWKDWFLKIRPEAEMLGFQMPMLRSQRSAGRTNPEGMIA